jgi:hypothetical protein
MVAAGSAWGLALACRVSLGPTVLVMTLATGLLARPRAARRLWLVVGDLVALAAPVAAVVGVLLVYNKARFDKWLEFGIGNQLSTMNFRTSRTYLAANIYSYLLRPLKATCAFPFAIAPWDIGHRGFPRGMKLAEGYATGEPVAGFLLAMPWCWLGLVAVALVGVATVRKLRAARAGGPPLDAVARGRLWCLICFATGGTLALIPVTPLFIATMRYLADITPCMVLLGIVGAWSLYELCRDSRWLRRAVVVVALAVGLFTIGVGTMQGFQGYYAHFRKNNPQLWNSMVRTFSVCNY